MELTLANVEEGVMQDFAGGITHVDIDRIFRERQIEWNRNKWWRRRTAIFALGFYVGVVYVAGKFLGAW